MKIQIQATRRAGGRVEIPIPEDFAGELSPGQEAGESLFVMGTRYVTLDEWRLIQKQQREEGEQSVEALGPVLVENDPLLNLPREISVDLARKMGLEERSYSLPKSSLVPLLREKNCLAYL